MSMSILTVQLPWRFTLSPVAGRTPPGHWVALLHNLTKFSLTKVPGGAGHKYLQIMPLTSVYYHLVLFLPDWQISIIL